MPSVRKAVPVTEWFPGMSTDQMAADLADAPALRAAFVTVIGSPTTPLTDPATPRPEGIIVGLWMMAAGVTPANAVAGDLIWNAA